MASDVAPSSSLRWSSAAAAAAVAKNPRPAAPPAASQPWTTARCHRLLRPLTSKLQALKSTIQTAPSTALPSPPTHKDTKPSFDQQPYNPTREDRPRAPSVARRPGSDRALFFGESDRQRHKRQRHTYSAAASRSNSRAPAPPPPPPPPVHTANPNAPAVVIASSVTVSLPGRTGTPESEPKKQQKELDPAHPLTQLNYLKEHTDPRIYAIYLGIYASFETVLTSTVNPSSAKAPTLGTIAARKIAHCILATSSDVSSDDVWYDTVGEIGLGGEHLRELVRWHAVEVVRDAMHEGLMPAKKDSLGLAGVLVGLCRLVEADAEAESLLQSMFDLHPLGTSPGNPALGTLTTFWAKAPSVLYRILASKLPRMSPVAMGNNMVNNVLRRAMEHIGRCERARELITVALGSVFGIWGENHALVMNEYRKADSRRKGNLRSARVPEFSAAEDTRRRLMKNSPSIHSRALQKAEEMVLTIVEDLFYSAFTVTGSMAVSMLSHIVQGFLVQDDVTKSHVENIWEKWCPVAGKVTFLLQALSSDHVDDEDSARIIQEIAHCVEEIDVSSGKDGVRSLATFVSSCFGKLYLTSGLSLTAKDEMKALIDRLLSSVTIRPGALPTADLSIGVTSSIYAPETPFRPNATTTTNIITFTPFPLQDTRSSASQALSAAKISERYYISTFALAVANEFSNLDFAKKHEGWIRWVDRVERRVVGLKARTPARPRHVESARKQKKGWRWEEGIDAWVAIGGTPGGAIKARKSGTKKGVPRNIAVVVGRAKGTYGWRGEYEVFEDSDLDSEDESAASSDSDSTEDKDIVRSFEPSPSPISASSSKRSSVRSSPVNDLIDHSATSLSPASASSDEEMDSDSDYDENYNTPPMTPQIRRSPRTIERIRQSLRRFSVVMPPPSHVREREREMLQQMDLNVAQGRQQSIDPNLESEAADDEHEDDGYVEMSPVVSRKRRRAGPPRLADNSTDTENESENGRASSSSSSSSSSRPPHLSTFSGSEEEEGENVEIAREEEREEEEFSEDELSIMAKSAPKLLQVVIVPSRSPRKQRAQAPRRVSVPKPGEANVGGRRERKRLKRNGY